MFKQAGWKYVLVSCIMAVALLAGPAWENGGLTAATIVVSVVGGVIAGVVVLEVIGRAGNAPSSR